MHAAATHLNSAARSPHTGSAPPTVGVQRRDPEQTLLHQTVRAHWNTLLAEVAQRTDGGSLPGFVRAEFERTLACGVLAHGFARVHRGSCGEDILVAFSSKNRGFCPSCTTRRMQGTAAHLLDHVLPRGPVRQWVQNQCDDSEVEGLALRGFQAANVGGVGVCVQGGNDGGEVRRPGRYRMVR